MLPWNQEQRAAEIAKWILDRFQMWTDDEPGPVVERAAELSREFLAQYIPDWKDNDE